MKSTNNTNKTRVAKRTDRGVPFEEMRRLMRVYGSIKCLRKRQTPDNANAKVESVKRKFYRWFPDLEERFERDAEGFYIPRLGHENELRYREEMRTKDGETLAKKRVKCRREREKGIVKRTVSTDIEEDAPPAPTFGKPLSDSARVSPISHAAESVCLSSFDRATSDDEDILGIKLELDRDDAMASANIAADTEPLDRSFVAEQGIFDNVEDNFFGLSEQAFSNSLSTDTEEQQDSSSSENDSSFLDDMIGQSIEDCCDDLLGSDDDSVAGYLMDIISS